MNHSPKIIERILACLKNGPWLGASIYLAPYSTKLCGLSHQLPHGHVFETLNQSPRRSCVHLKHRKRLLRAAALKQRG